MFPDSQAFPTGFSIERRVFGQIPIEWNNSNRIPLVIPVNILQL